MQKKLLIIGWVWPEPKSSAAGSRMMQLIAFFQHIGYQITFASPAQLSSHMEDLAALDIEQKEITLNCDSFDDYLDQLQPDAVMYDRYMIEEQFGWRVAKVCPNAIRILDTEDLQSLRNARHQAVKQSIPVEQASKNTDLAIREVSAIMRSDFTIMISKAEVELLTSHYKVDDSLLVYSPFMLEDEELSQSNPSFSERAQFITIGNFRHAPNWDAVLWLKQQIWPLIRQQLPKAELCIYGAYPPKKATDLHDEKSGFLVKGWADDAIEIMKKARVCLAPLRFGAGIKGKLAEAMYCGTPSITTNIGAEGMHGKKPWGGAVTDDVDDFVKQAVQCYQDEAAWQQASENGTFNAQSLFNKTDHYPLLQQTLEAIEADLEKHRENNFIGAMLNHHSHRSTQFMSQWIAAKNKLEQL